MKNILIAIFLLVPPCLLTNEDKPQTPIDIVGIWDQYLYYYKDGEYAYHYACTVQVVRVKSEYELRKVATSKNPEIIDSIRVSEVKFDGKTWTFYSDWGEYGLGFFKLEMKERNIFEGYSYATDEKKKPTYKLDPNRWIRHDL